MIQCTCGRRFTSDAAGTAVRCPACGASIVVLPGGAQVAHSLRFPVVLWLLAVLAVILLPAWMRVEGTGHLEITNQFVAVPLLSVVRAMFNPWLPVALALLLSVRAGVLNLSVWGCTALGAVVCWAVVAAGGPLPAALPAAVVAGGALGGGAAVFSRRLKAPVWLVTAVVGVGVMNLMRWPASRLAVLGPGTLDGYGDTLSRMLITVLLYAGAALGVGRIRRVREPRKSADPASLWALALCVGGAVAAGAGGVMVLAAGRFHPGGWLWGDLRVVAAVVLCGGWVWRSRRVAALPCLLLPVAMGVATMWMQTVGLWLPGLRGTWPLAGLIVLVAGTQWASHGRGQRVWRYAAGGLAGGGTVLVALGAYWPFSAASIFLAAVGSACWALGVVVGLARRRLGTAAAVAERGVAPDASGRAADAVRASGSLG